MSDGPRADRAADLFQRAIELPTPAREQLLAHECAGDPALLEDVESLLEVAQELPDGFMKSDPAASSPTATDTAPATIGAYHLVREIGRGGQAIVHLAKDTRLDRVVALKLIRGPGAGSHQLLERFKREASVASNLRHDAICAVLDAGIADGVAYIAMQYVDGETLAKKIAATKAAHHGTSTCVEIASTAEPALMRVVKLVEAIARALHVAHEAGVVHRDVKPANIMIDRDARPVILDFGLAHQDDSELPTLTQSGDFFGTPAYMSPEQLSGKRSRVDRRTDVWSLGVTLQECLTLRRPFEAATREGLFQAILTEEPADPRRANPSVPRDLATVVATALEKNPDRRYQTALDLAEDLRRIAAVEPIRARPAGPWVKLARWGQRNPGFAGSLLSAFVFLVAGLGVSLWLLDQARSERDLSLRRAYRASIAAASTAIELDDMAAARRNLDEAPAEHKGFEWRLLDWLANRSLMTLKGDGPPLTSFAFGDQGRRIIAVDEAGAVFTWDLATGARIGEARALPSNADAWFSPDATRVLLPVHGERLSMWDLVGGRELWSVPASGWRWLSPFDREGKSVILTNSTPMATLRDVETGKEIGAVPVPRDAEAARFDAAAKRVLTCTASSLVKVIDRSSGRQLWRTRARAAHFIGDGAVVLGAPEREGREEAGLVAWDADSGRERQQWLLGRPGTIVSCAESPDGAVLCAGLELGALAIWDRDEPRPRVVLLAHNKDVEQILFTPDGSRIVTRSGNELRIWDRSMTPDPRVVSTAGTDYGARAFSPDGRRLATSRWGDLVLFDVAAGREIRTAFVTRAIFKAIAWDPEGRRIAASASDGRCYVLDAGSSKPLKVFPLAATRQLVWTKKLLLCCDETAVRGVDVDRGEVALKIESATPIRAFAASPEGSSILLGLANGEIHLRAPDSESPLAILRAHRKAVTCLALSADGRRLVSGSEDYSGATWDLETRARIATLASWDTPLSAMAFNSQGTRIVGSDRRGCIRIWDALGGDELLALRDPKFNDVTAIAWDEDVLRLSDARHPIVSFEIGVPREGFREADAVREARARLNRLFDKGAQTALSADVIERLRADSALSESARALAIELASARGDDLNRLNGYSWDSVRIPEATALHPHALHQIESVCAIWPDDAAFLNTLALARYRVGKFEGAIKATRRADEIWRARGRPGYPGDGAIRAMAEFRLGRIEAAEAELVRTRAAAVEPPFADDTDCKWLLVEAAALIEAGAASRPGR